MMPLPPYLDSLPTPHRSGIEALLRQQAALRNSDRKGVVQFRQLYESVCHLRADYHDFSGDAVTIGRTGELNESDQGLVFEVLRSFMPWRKGPFSVFGTEIDAEWRSERKWNRVLPALPELRDAVIADIGSNNGYYMFRMAHHRPRLVLGFEPYLQHYFTFRTLNGFAGQANLVTELLGVEHLGLFENCFDLVFLMGILYHRSAPIDVLKNVFAALKPGGTLIVESQGIPGNEPVALFPERRYAKVPGTYFIPTGTCLCNWLIRAGFSRVTLFDSHPMSSEEQRRTDWMEFESYADFIDPDKPHLTVEGYPAPVRLFVRGEK